MRAIALASAQSLLLTVLTAAIVSGCSQETSDEAIRNGQAALRDGDHPQAVKHLARAAKLNPQNALVHYNLGMAQLLSGDYKGAARSFDASDRLDREGGTDALEGLALARREAGDPDGAISAFERAFAKVNRKPHLLAGMAVCEMEKGNMEYARQLLDEALITDPNDPVALFNLAALMQKPHFNDPQIAAAHYVRFLINAPQDAYAVERQKALARLKEIDASRPAGLQLEIDDKIMEARAARRPADALLAAAEAVKLDESNPDAFWLFQQTLLKAGRSREAGLALTRFRIVFPDDPRGRGQ
ncbi:MAG: tetratricopeptide repeat protein [Kiritimatiellia bacterium]|jgi:tetratricopeptide (TPR) repeat protein